MSGAGYGCPFGDDEHTATVLVTWLARGATIAVCDDHFSPAMINVLANDLGVDPGKLYETVKRFVDREAARAAKQAAKAAPDGAGEPAGDEDREPSGAEAES